MKSTAPPPAPEILTPHSSIRIFGYVDTLADQLFRALSDSGRRDLLRLLGEAPLTVGEMVDILKLPQSTVSRQLKALRDTGLLQERRDGARVYCALVEPASNGHAGLPDLLNRWLREQPLSPVVRRRLESVISGRNGGEDAFDRLAHQWDEMRRGYFGSQFHLEALTALLPPHWRVLDIGTGTGYLLPTLARHFQHVTAVDPSPAMLGLARQRAEREELTNVTFSFGQLEELPVDSESIDAIVAILVLHHSVSLPQAASELHRVLRPEGALLAVDLFPHDMEEFRREMGDPVLGLEPDKLCRHLEQAGLHTELRRRLELPPPELPEGPDKASPDLYLLKCRRADRPRN